MSNNLENGGILPTGLLSTSEASAVAGFNKTYRNVQLRAGIVVDTFTVKDEQNHSKLTTEYNVLIVEQNEDRGATTQLYRNCMSAEGLGAVADFFEKTLRKSKNKTNKGSLNFKGQNGAIVLVLCLDGMSDKGIIIGALTHPDRGTKLSSEDPYLEGEYNGVNIKVDTDGSATFTFKGATDNDGKAIDASQGNTVVKVEKDGSYAVTHKSITQRFDKGGDASLTADGNISNTTKKDFSATADDNINLTATKDFNLKCQQLVANAEGSATFQCQSLDVQAKSDINIKGSQLNIEAQAMATIKAPQITLDGLTFLGGAGGQPLLTLTAQMFGIGNLGLPVISTPISGFTIKTFGT